MSNPETPLSHNSTGKGGINMENPTIASFVQQSKQNALRKAAREKAIKSIISVLSVKTPHLQGARSRMEHIDAANEMSDAFDNAPSRGSAEHAPWLHTKAYEFATQHNLIPKTASALAEIAIDNYPLPPEASSQSED